MIRRFQLSFFTPFHSEFFWLLRANVVLLRDIRTVEVNFGLLGFGAVLIAGYGQHRSAASKGDANA